MDCKIIGALPAKFEMTARVYDCRGISPAIRPFSQGGGNEVKIAVYENDMPEQQGKRKAAFPE